MNATPNEDCDRGAFEELSDQLRAPVQIAYLPEQLQSLLGSAVAHCVRGLDDAPLWYEVVLLERLRGHHKTQHRRSRMYARVNEVCRTLRLLRRLQLHESCAALFVRGAFGAGKTWLPSRQHGVHVSRRLLAAARLCAGARKQVLCAAVECNVLLAASFFMPLALTLVATLGRVGALLRALQARCVDTYNALLPVLSWLPVPVTSHGHAQGRCTTGLSTRVVTLPALLRSDWGADGAADAVTPVGVHQVHMDRGDGAAAALSIDGGEPMPLTVLESRRAPTKGEDMPTSPAFVRVPVLQPASASQQGGASHAPGTSPLNWLLGGTDMDHTSKH